MKKLLLTCAVVLISATGTYAQEDGFFNKQLKTELMDFLVLMGEASSDDYDEISLNLPNFFITNLLTRSNVELFDDQYEYGIYSFSTLDDEPIHIFLKKGNEYQILQMNGEVIFKNGEIIFDGSRSLEEIILELFRYFKDNPEVDSQLLPLYTNAVIRVYTANYHVSISSRESVKEEYERILNGEILFIE